jgi:hypothetical protein
MGSLIAVWIVIAATAAMDHALHFRVNAVLLVSQMYIEILALHVPVLFDCPIQTDIRVLKITSVAIAYLERALQITALAVFQVSYNYLGIVA